MKKLSLVGVVLAALSLLIWRRAKTPRHEAPDVRLSAPQSEAFHRHDAAAGLDLAAKRPSDNLSPREAVLPAAPKSADAVPSGQAPPPSRPVQNLSPAEKLAEFDAIIESGNDNDPRLDTDFNVLTPEAKNLFRRRYAQAPPEEHNTRGTIVFLLGRNLSGPEDWAFLRSVVGEPPCLSLADCSREPASNDAHGEGNDRVTLAYPRLVALKQVERALDEARKPGGKRDAEALREAWSVLSIAKESKEPIVADAAAELESRFGH